MYITRILAKKNKNNLGVVCEAYDGNNCVCIDLRHSGKEFFNKRKTCIKLNGNEVTINKNVLDEFGIKLNMID